jgi:hypothetical protein
MASAAGNRGAEDPVFARIDVKEILNARKSKASKIPVVKWFHGLTREGQIEAGLEEFAEGYKLLDDIRSQGAMDSVALTDFRDQVER